MEVIRRFFSSIMTFFTCLVGVAVVIDPQSVLDKAQVLSEIGIQTLMEQLKDLSGLMQSLLRDLRRR